MKHNHSKTNMIVISLLIMIILMLIVGGGISLSKYCKVKSLCDDIREGKHIETDIGNGLSAPLWLDGFFTTTQLAEIQIPLVEACRCGHLQAVEVLLKNNADPNYSYKGYLSPIEAVYRYVRDPELRSQIINLLIEYGADVNLAMSGDPIIFEIAGGMHLAKNTKQSEQEILFLLNHGGIREKQNGISVFWFAVRGASPEFLEILITDYQFNVNQRGYLNQTPLMQAILYQNPQTTPEQFSVLIQLLLNYGADIRAVDDNGKTAYDYAIENGYTDLAELIKP